MSKLFAILLLAILATALAMPEGYFRVKRSPHGYYKKIYVSPWHQNYNRGGYDGYYGGGNYGGGYYGGGNYGGGGVAPTHTQAQASASSFAGGSGNHVVAGASSSSFASGGRR